MPDKGPPDARELGYYVTLAQVSIEMVVPLFAGLAVDYFAGTMPWLTLIGLVIGFVGGIFHLVALANQSEAARQDQEKRKGKPP